MSHAAAPGLQGFRWPAEWEPQAAVWLAWPASPLDWPGRLQGVRFAFADMVRRLAMGQEVRVLAHSPAVEHDARKRIADVGGDLSRVRFTPCPIDRSWMRDSAPLFVRNAAGETRAVGFRFTAWAKYPDHARDARIAGAVARAAGLPLFHVKRNGRAVVLEGGALEGNGRGTLLTTEECLLDQETQARNPGFTKAGYEAVFREALGASNVFWLGRGIAGDDTHGHVDDLCRFVNPRTLVLIQEKNPADVNYRPLQENRERLQDLRLEDGGKPEIVHLPMPGPLFFRGSRLPASYANFLIANACVLAPTFNDPRDREALGVLAELCDRPVIGIHAQDLVQGRGAIHCLTMQQAGTKK